jgi:hypothetical protein
MQVGMAGLSLSGIISTVKPDYGEYAKLFVMFAWLYQAAPGSR